MHFFEDFDHKVLSNLVLYVVALLVAIFCAAIVLIFLVTVPLTP
jgi:hypothetical protein